MKITLQETLDGTWLTTVKIRNNHGNYELAYSHITKGLGEAYDELAGAIGAAGGIEQAQKDNNT